jgi:hypothetical protein
VVKPYILDLIKCAPAKHWAGLDYILLTDAAGQSRSERRKKSKSRKRKVSSNESLGLYRQSWSGKKPYIQLHVDAILGDRKRPKNPLCCLAFPLVRRHRFAYTLYHELGHHIHHTHRPEHGEPENVPDRYLFDFLTRMMIRRWYLVPPAVIGIITTPSNWKPFYQFWQESKALKKK